MPEAVAAARGLEFLLRLMDLADDMYRLRRVTETKLLVDLVRKVIAAGREEIAPPPSLLLRSNRRHAQCLQAEGHFQAASELFAELSSG